MSPLIARVRLAREVRRSRCALSEACAQLCDVGLNDVLFQLSNVEVQLEQIYLQLMEPTRQLRARRNPSNCSDFPDDIPF